MHSIARKWTEEKQSPKGIWPWILLSCVGLLIVGSVIGGGVIVLALLLWFILTNPFL